MTLVGRRAVLRGLGASVALPYLESLAGAVAQEERPRRCAFLYFPNGVNTLTWQIREAGAGYRPTEPFAPLAGLRDHITPISGLHHPNGLGQAHECEKIWLTAAKVSQEGGAFRNSLSADQRIAAVAGAHTRFPSLEMAVTGGTLAWSADGIPIPAERNPARLFDRLFGDEPGGAAAARRRLDRRGSVLDVVLDQARGVRRTIGAEDRSSLDEYLHSVREVELRTERSVAWLDVPKPPVDAETKARFRTALSPAEAGEIYRTVYDLMVLAFRTDMTRVITCMTGSEAHGLALPEIAIAQTRHELSHHNGDPEQLRRLSQADLFLMEQFAYLVERLKSAREGEASLLDRTVLVYGSGMCYGHSHGNANLPTIVAGGRSLGLKHGRHLDYNLPKIGAYDLADVKRQYGICSRPADPEARVSNLLLTVIRAMGVEADRFGDSLRPMTELLA